MRTSVTRLRREMEEVQEKYVFSFSFNLIKNMRSFVDKTRTNRLSLVRVSWRKSTSFLLPWMPVSFFKRWSNGCSGINTTAKDKTWSGGKAKWSGEKLSQPTDTHNILGGRTWWSSWAKTIIATNCDSPWDAIGKNEGRVAEWCIRWYLLIQNDQSRDSTARDTEIEELRAQYQRRVGDFMVQHWFTMGLFFKIIIKIWIPLDLFKYESLFRAVLSNLGLFLLFD